MAEVAIRHCQGFIRPLAEDRAVGNIRGSCGTLQELRGCRKRERESRFKDVRGGRAFHSTPFQPPVVGSPEADGGMVSDALQGIGMVHDAPPLDYAQVVQNCRTRSSARVLESGAAHSSKRGRK